MADLWDAKRRDALRAVEPLAARMRPRTLDEFAGQSHLLGPGKLLRRMVSAGTLSSLILHGPPGTGKTSLARAIAHATGRHFEQENASSVGVARIREILAAASTRLADGGQRSILFLDEIHRFSKSQQDVLLPDVERGIITLIGATTENPLFSVNSALVSRSTLCRLEPLSEADIVLLLRRAAADPERGYGRLGVTIDDDALALWASKCDGDARRALTALEVAVLSARHGGANDDRVPDLHLSGGVLLDRGRADLDLPRRHGGAPPHSADGQGQPTPDGRAEAGAAADPSARPALIHITRAVAQDSIQQKAAVYDGTGDGHYDTISAFIKSVRGSDPDAALYWLARMIDAGEDPRFIARRLAILASEDIGNADPRGIMVAAAAWELVERIGMPEARITLSQATIYLALAPKSNASYTAIDAALDDVRQGRSVAVPSAIKDGNVRKASEMSAGTQKGERYEYAHDAATSGAAGQVGGVTAQDYLGVSRRYYTPTARGLEAQLAQRLDAVRAERERLAAEQAR